MKETHKPKKLCLLKDMTWNCKGDKVSVILETDGEVYYYDSMRRYCYIEKTELGTTFEWC